MHARRFAIYGVFFGLGFPVIGTVIEAFTRGYGLGVSGLVQAQASDPLLWIIDTAPFFLGVLAYLAGRSQDNIVELEKSRRDGYDRTASELFTAAQALLSTVSSFSSMTAETAASVRETTATMGHLGHTATQETMSSTQAVATEAKALNDLAQGLKRAVDV